MTISGYSSYSSSLYSTGSAAASGFAQFASKSGSANSSSSGVQGSAPPPPLRMDDSAREAAMAKLQEIDPDLAKKMEEFQQKIEDMRESGASREEVHDAMKSNMDSLSDTEKSELQSVFGKPPAGGRGPGGPGGPPPGGGPGGPDRASILSSLKESNPELAEKLEGFEEAIESLKENGASPEEVGAKWKQQIESLSDEEEADLKAAFEAARPTPPNNSENSILKQAVSAYAKAQSLMSQQFSQQSLAFSA